MNIIKIFKDDVKRIVKNPIAILVIIGITILPSLYAWFNIIANWDPYSNTKGLSIAVCNEDEGAKLSGNKVNLGNNVSESLKNNDKMGWDFVNREKAVEGTKSGKYYAAIIIPKEFSENIISVLSGDIKRPEIIYYCNDKKNAIATKMTNSGISTIQKQVNETFIKTVTKTVEDMIIAANDGEDKYKISENIVSKLDEINGDLDNTKDSLNAFNECIKSFKELNKTLESSLNGVSSSLDTKINSLSASKNSINNIGNSASILSNSTYNSLNNSMNNIINKLNEGKNLLNKASGNVDTSKLNEIINDLNEKENTLTNEVNKAVNESINATKNEAINNVNSLIGNLQGLKTNIESVKSVLNQMEDALDKTNGAISATAKIIDNIQRDIKESKDKVKDLSSSEALNNIMDTLSNNTELISEFMSAPVQVKTEEIYKVSNYGSAMTPFYSILAIWVGGIILVAILKTNIKNKEPYKNLKPYEEYLGRYILFFILSFIQSTIICLGDIFYLKIQCDNRLAFMITGWVAGFIFSLIIYTLTISFGDIGKALCVLLLVIQLAGAGGTFPIEVTPEFFQRINRFLPFTHGINAMREAVAGMYNMDFVKFLGYLLCYIPFALVLGLLLRNPLIHANEYFEKKLKNTEIM